MITPESLYLKDTIVFKEDDWYLLNEKNYLESSCSQWWVLHICNPHASISTSDVYKNFSYSSMHRRNCSTCNMPVPEAINTLLVLLSDKPVSYT